MTQYTRLASLVKTTTAGLLSASVLLSATAQAVVSQAPLSLTEGVAPNLIVTIDESTSMDSAFVPDGLGYTGERRFRANTFNAMAYNPAITYKIPPSFQKNGDEKFLSTSFNTAYNNGFKPKSGEAKNLVSDYNVAQTVKIRDTETTVTHPSIRNPEYDFRCGIKTSKLTKNNQTHTCTGDPQNGYSAWNADELDNWQTRSGEITITRTGSSSCTAIMKADGVVINNVPCSRRSISGTYYYIADLTKASVPAYYYVADKNFGASADNNNDSLSADSSGGNADCKDSCYRLVFVTATSGQLRADDVASGRDERQNFANWYSFYRSRSLATISAASLAFYDLSNSTRMTWQNLSDCKQLNKANSTRCGDNRFREYSKEQRGEFYHWMQNMRMNNATPLPTAMRRAGEFLRTDDTAWHAYPNNSNKQNTAKNTYSCRPSYHVMMTDGLWQTDIDSSSTITRRDGDSFTLPEGSRNYPAGNHTKIYVDNAPAYTVADVAMNYWANDLRTGLTNKVPAYIPYKNTNSDIEFWDPRNNPATWQHMTNFIMGLGLTNALNNPDIPWEGGTYEGEGYKKLKDGTVSWPPASRGSSNNVYDLWHAAINSRGEFFSVDSPDAMVQAFSNILTRIASRKSTAAAPATSNSLEADITNPEDPQDRLVSYSYQSSFDNTEDWVGDLKMVKSWRQWVSDGEGGGGFESHSEDVWSASSLLKGERTVKMAGSNGLQEFTTTNANSKLKSWLNINPETGVVDNRWDDRLNYIRGVRSNEGEGSTDFRKRSSLLGDFLASQPAVVQRPQYLERFANTLEGPEDSTKYTDFVTQTNSREARIYIGGNDGMLHAFDAGVDGGKETFAFIPTAVFPNLNKLTGKNYTHHYYVDGSPEVADVYDSEAGVWKTILVGTLRAGGKGLFALDITTPGQEELLWEFDEFNYQSNAGHTSGMVGPGYSFPKPTIARLHNGRWAVVTGNGYEGANTANGKAALYIIDAMTGKLHKSLEVQSSTKKDNGLSSPRLADYDGDGVADYAYAGDLHGNLWRFDLFGTGASTDRDLADGPIYGNKNSLSTDGFKVSYAGKPVFTATASKDNALQPITAAPSLSRHPSGNGYLVILGTGKYFEDGDKTGTETHAQSLYAIWDEKTKAESTGGVGMPIARNNLVKQEIKATNLDAKGLASGLDRKARTLSDEAVRYYDADGKPSKKGWYLDLAAGTTYEGEMMIENMRVLGRDTLLISTLVPNDDPCAHGAGNWLYALNPATGGRTKHHAFDTRVKNQDGSYTLVSAIKLGSEGGLSLGQDELGITAFGETIDLGNSGRLRGNRAGSWRMIPDP